MRIHLLSDLHLEHGAYAPVPVDADVVVIAGDIWSPSKGNPDRAVVWAREAFPDQEVVMVSGNHDFYGGNLGKTNVKWAETARRLGVHYLDMGEVSLGGVRFLGATLWTDYAVNGDAIEGMRLAELRMNDYRAIRYYPGYQRLRAHHLLAAHRRQVGWLRERLLADRCPTVVVTHTAPSLRSIEPGLEARPETVAYASDLAALMAETGIPLWLHGHTHWPVDYRVGCTRVVSNPRGYASEPVAGFVPDLVIEFAG